jgi:hypothetical protein
MARPVFKLFGMIGMKGIEKVEKDLKGVDKTAKDLQKSLTRTGRNISKMGGSLSKKLTAPIVALAGGLTLLSQKTGEYADKILDLEQVTGLSVQNLQKFELVSKEAGVSFEGFVGVIGKFQSRLPQILSGTGRAAETIKALGVNVKDSQGKIKDMNTLFPQLIGALQGVEDITERNTMAQQLFGRSMGDLAPILGMTADDLNRIGQEAEDMGAILDKDALNSANNFRISMEKLQAQFTSVFRVIATKFIPILNDTIIPLIRNTVIPVILGFGDAIGAVLNWFNSLTPEVKKISIVMLGVVAALGPVLMLSGKFVLALKSLVPLLVLARKGMILLSAAMAANPIGAVIVLVIGLVTVMGLLKDENGELKASFQDAWDSIAHHVDLAVSSMRKSWYDLLRDALRVVDGMSQFIPGLGEKIKKARQHLRDLSREESRSMRQKRIYRKEIELQNKANDALSASIDGATKTINGLIKAQTKESKILVEQTELMDSHVKAYEEGVNAKADLEEEWSERLANSLRTRRGLLEAEYREALSQADQLGADRNDIELYYSIQRMKMAQDEEREKQRLEDETAKKRVEQAEFTKNLTINTIGQTLDTISQFYGMQIERVEAKKQTDIDAVNASVMSEEEKAHAIGEIEEKSAKKIKELKRKQAIADKASAIFGIAINTAKAIVTAFAMLGPIAGGVAAGFLGGLGAAQAAIVAARPIPLAKGGLVKRTPGGVNTIVGEGKEDEMVLPLKTGVTQLAENLYSKVREMSFNGMGIPAIAGGGGRAVENHWHIGTLVANDQGIKELERRQRKFRTEEDQRRGLEN